MTSQSCMDVYHCIEHVHIHPDLQTHTKNISIDRYLCNNTRVKRCSLFTNKGLVFHPTNQPTMLNYFLYYSASR